MWPPTPRKESLKRTLKAALCNIESLFGDEGVVKLK